MTAGSSAQIALTELFNSALDRHVGADASLCVAFSGGVDSTVMLWLAAKTQSRPVRAVHVNHGLQADADAWAQHCVAVSENLGVSCTVMCVDVARQGDGLEAAARKARYAALEAKLMEQEVLLTAHHEQDQLETFLLQMLRGSGVKGLAAMPAYTAEKGYRHARPLLLAEPERLRQFADEHGLDWHEDPSNADTNLDRNFLRHRILPVLAERWPAAARSVSRAARHSAEAAELLDELAKEDLAGQDAELMSAGAGLSVTLLRQLSPVRRKNALRYAIRSHGLPVPSEEQLLAAMQALMSDRPDSQPLAAWPGVRIRRYQDGLWFFSEAADPGNPELTEAGRYELGLSESLDMGRVRGTLRMQTCEGDGFAARWLEQGLSVRFRQGGEKLRPNPGGRKRDLKKLLQEREVVPWMREHIPLIYSGEKLLAVGDMWIEADCQAASGEAGFRLIWSKHVPLILAFPLSGGGLSGNL